MRFRLSLAMASVLAVGAVSTGAAAPIPATVGLDIVSQYVWRGWKMTDEVTVQPSASLDLGPSGFSLGLWGSFASQNRDLYDAADELDFSVAYERGLGALWNPVTVGFGYTRHTFPNLDLDNGSNEAYLRADAALPMLNAGASLAHDFDLLDGNYLEGHVSPPASLLSQLPLPGLNLELGLGVSDYDQSWGFQDFKGVLSLNLPLGPWLSAGPMAGFSYSDEALNGPDDKGNWFAGLSIRALN
ncbi:MAG TPA: TorF family putative porin [Candidatus Krumholzibacteria bacterium]|jgi:uncharacterized protein (TIGR02001 family)